MSWSRGSELMTKIIEVLVTNVEDSDVRTLIYEEIASAIWEDFDCDTLDECTSIDPAFDEALNTIGYLDDQDYDDDWFEEDYSNPYA